MANISGGRSVKLKKERKKNSFRTPTVPSSFQFFSQGKERSRAAWQLVTYVLPADWEPTTERTTALADRRTEVDEAGIRLVIEHEERKGRFPELMPHTNRGYDIVSRKAPDGEILRYIEVKSLSGEWKSAQAAVSRAQFMAAEEDGDLFWLYVVERATHEDCRIYRIQDHAQQVTTFAYDYGWHALDEDDEETR